MDRPGTCIIILDKKYNIANSSCHFRSYGSIWTGPYTAIWPSVPWTICYIYTCIYWFFRPIFPNQVSTSLFVNVNLQWNQKKMHQWKWFLLGYCIFISVPWLSWWYDSWIYNYLCNQCLSPLKLWVRIPLRRGILDTALCDKVDRSVVFSRYKCTPVSSTNKTECHDIQKCIWNIVVQIINLILMKYFNSKDNMYFWHCDLHVHVWRKLWLFKK
jgi:hypothetical protein